MRWTAKPGLTLAIWCGAGLVAGCAAGSDGSATGPATTGPTATATAPVAPGATSASTAAEADEVCARIDAQIAAVPQPAGAGEVEPYLRRLVATYRVEVAELRGLAERDGDPRWQQLVTELSAYFDLVEADLPQLAQDPTRMNAPGTPTGQALDRARHEAEALGLRVCGAAGTGSSSDGATPTTAGATP